MPQPNKNLTPAAVAGNLEALLTEKVCQRIVVVTRYGGIELPVIEIWRDAATQEIRIEIDTSKISP